MLTSSNLFPVIVIVTSERRLPFGALPLPPTPTNPNPLGTTRKINSRCAAELPRNRQTRLLLLLLFSTRWQSEKEKKLCFFGFRLWFLPTTDTQTDGASRLSTSSKRSSFPPLKTKVARTVPQQGCTWWETRLADTWQHTSRSVGRILSRVYVC
jgi:hypothetical protein